MKYQFAQKKKKSLKKKVTKKKRQVTKKRIVKKSTKKKTNKLSPNIKPLWMKRFGQTAASQPKILQCFG